jgi:cytochrome d ubiquinol oxidase subunit II
LPAFYVPVLVMLFALIFRGVAFEFRFQAKRYRRAWDYAFVGGSVLATVSQGFVLGGFIQGVVMRNGVFAGGTFDFVGVLGVLCAVGLVGGYALLGAGWLVWKTDGPTQTFGREIGRAALILTATMMALVSAWTALTQVEVAERWFAWPRILPQALLPAAAICVVVLTWRSLWGRREALPFLLAVVLFLFGFGGLVLSLWPYVVPRHVTIWTGASDEASLRFAGVALALVLPIVLGYTGYAYWIFRGKTVSTHHSGHDDGEEADAAQDLAARPTSPVAAPGRI